MDDQPNAAISRKTLTVPEAGRPRPQRLLRGSAPRGHPNNPRRPIAPGASGGDGAQARGSKEMTYEEKSKAAPLSAQAASPARIGSNSLPELASQIVREHEAIQNAPYVVPRAIGRRKFELRSE